MRRRLLVSAFVLFVLAGCQVALPALSPQQVEEDPPVISAVETVVEPEVQVERKATSTPTSPAMEQPCAYQWASQDLPEVTEQLTAAFAEAGVEGVQVRAQAFGENCILPDGTVSRFLTMQTDFYLTFPDLKSLDDETLGQLLEPPLEVLLSFPPETFPGPQRGNVGARFLGPESERNLWFRLQQAEDLLNQGLHGASLIQVLTPP